MNTIIFLLKLKQLTLGAAGAIHLQLNKILRNCCFKVQIFGEIVWMMKFLFVCWKCWIGINICSYQSGPGIGYVL